MLCSGKGDSVCYRWIGVDIMSEEQLESSDTTFMYNLRRDYRRIYGGKK